jgi:hypothetical protein
MPDPIALLKRSVKLREDALDKLIEAEWNDQRRTAVYDLLLEGSEVDKQIREVLNPNR